MLTKLFAVGSREMSHRVFASRMRAFGACADARRAGACRTRSRIAESPSAWISAPAAISRSYGAAVSWSPMSAKYRALGRNRVSRSEVRIGTATYGARLMVPVFKSFARSAWRRSSAWVVRTRSGVNDWQIPLGISRRLSARARREWSWHFRVCFTILYAGRAFAQNQQTETHGLFRVSLGVDAAVLPQVGVTVGYETGAEGRSRTSRRDRRNFRSLAFRMRCIARGRAMRSSSPAGAAAECDAGFDIDPEFRGTPTP